MNTMQNFLLNLGLFIILSFFLSQPTLSQNMDSLKLDSTYTLTGQDLVNFIRENCTGEPDTVYIKDTVVISSQDEITLIEENVLKEDFDDMEPEEILEKNRLKFKDVMFGLGEGVAMVIMAPFAIGFEVWDRVFGDRCDCEVLEKKEEEKQRRKQRRKYKKPKKKKYKKLKVRHKKLKTLECPKWWFS